MSGLQLRVLLLFICPLCEAVAVVVVVAVVACVVAGSLESRLPGMSLKGVQGHTHAHSLRRAPRTVYTLRASECNENS